jgi:hypothetical protein
MFFGISRRRSNSRGGKLGISAVAGNFRTAKRDQIMQDIAADYSTNIKTSEFSRRN